MQKLNLNNLFKSSLFFLVISMTFINTTLASNEDCDYGVTPFISCDGSSILEFLHVQLESIGLTKSNIEQHEEMILETLNLLIEENSIDQLDLNDLEELLYRFNCSDSSSEILVKACELSKKEDGEVKVNYITRVFALAYKIKFYKEDPTLERQLEIIPIIEEEKEEEKEVVPLPSEEEVKALKELKALEELKSRCPSHLSGRFHFNGCPLVALNDFDSEVRRHGSPITRREIARSYKALTKDEKNQLKLDTITYFCEGTMKSYNKVVCQELYTKKARWEKNKPYRPFLFAKWMLPLFK